LLHANTKPLPKAIVTLIDAKRKALQKLQTERDKHAHTAMEKQMKDELNEKVPVSGKSRDKSTAGDNTQAQDAVSSSSSASCKALSVSAALNNLRAFALKARPKLFVFSFNGEPLPTSPLEFLSKLINLLIICASPYDEVVVRLTSPGGLVAHYGLAAAQLHRLKKAGIKLTVCVDTVAASGGYMMACVADKIIASPFAYIGSIGVYGFVPNLHKFLEKRDVNALEFTAGKHKRPVSIFGKVTVAGKKKFQQQLSDIHDAFKSHVKFHRKQVDIDKIGTGFCVYVFMCVCVCMMYDVWWMMYDVYARCMMYEYDVWCIWYMIYDVENDLE